MVQADAKAELVLGIAVDVGDVVSDLGNVHRASVIVFFIVQVTGAALGQDTRVSNLDAILVSLAVVPVHVVVTRLPAIVDDPDRARLAALGELHDNTVLGFLSAVAAQDGLGVLVADAVPVTLKVAQGTELNKGEVGNDVSVVGGVHDRSVGRRFRRIRIDSRFR